MSGQVNAETIADAIGLTRQAVNVRANEQHWPFISLRGRGGRQKMYAVGALPTEVQDRVVLHLAEREERLKAALSAGVATGLAVKNAELLDAKAGDAARQAGAAAWMKLPVAGKRRADAKVAVVTMAKRYIQVAGLPKVRGRTLFAHAYSAGQIAVPDDLRALIPSVSPNTLENWEKALAGEGIARLGGKYGHRKGSGVIDSHEPLNLLVRAMIAHHPDTSAKHVMRAIRAEIEPAFHPSFRTLQRWMAAFRIEHEQALLKVNNPDLWRSKYQAAAGSASENIVRLNQRWETDGTKGDLLLADGRRHSIVGVIDVYSRRLKLHVSRTSNSASVASVLRRCMLEWGVCEQLGTDNGSDFTSSHVVRICDALGIERDVAAPFTPEHKPFIERAFGTFCRDLVEWLPGYIGHDVAERKAIESKRSFAQRLMKGDGAPIETLLTPEELQKFCDDWTDKTYAFDPHSGLGGKAPYMRALEWTAPIRQILDERALDVLLLPAAGKDGLREVVKKGIRYDGAYFSAGALGAIMGETVQVLIDDADIGQIYVFDQDGAFVCKAICPERLGISHAEVAAEMTATQRQIMNEKTAEIRRLTKRIRKSDLLASIRAKADADFGKVTRLHPAPTVEHSTPDLVAAGRAARAGDMPQARDLTEDQQQRLDALEAELGSVAETEAPAPVAQIVTMPARESRRSRFERARSLQQLVADDHEVRPADKAWLLTYMDGPEYNAIYKLVEDFGEAALESL